MRSIQFNDEYMSLFAVLLEFPIAVVERANLPSLEPPGDAVEVESMLKMLIQRSNRSKGSCGEEWCRTYVANSPRDCAFFAHGARLVSLAFDTWGQASVSKCSLSFKQHVA